MVRNALLASFIGLLAVSQVERAGEVESEPAGHDLNGPGAVERADKRQEGRRNDENSVRCNNAPLHGLHGAAMHAHPLAECGEPRRVQGREAVVAT